MVRLAKALREEAAKEANQECGLKWSRLTGSSLSPKNVRVAATRAGREKFEITESLFADDSTLIGWTSELKLGKEVVKQAMKDYEEKCHDGKEESISFGTEAANKTRMLETRIGRKDDLKARVQRGNAAWYKTKKWLWRSKQSMRTQALVVQAVEESTTLFDCMVHTWTATEIQKMQSVPDNAYRWIWNHKRGLAKLRMQKEHVDAYEIRGQLGIASMRTKIETRTLSRIGHILHMPNERPTKRIILGTWENEPEVRGGLKRGTLWY